MNREWEFLRGALFVVVPLVFLCAASDSFADFLAGAAAYGKKDYTTAFHEFRPLAEKGDAASQSMIGTMYLQGKGVPQDPKTAAAWYEKASSHGDPSAQYALAQLYYSGVGVQQDTARAALLYEKAADQGLLYAMYTIGVMYSKGEGVRRDLILAHKWLNLAASYSDTPETTEYIHAASTERTKLESEMTQAQIQQAQVLATKWDETRKAKNAALEKEMDRAPSKVSK